MNAAGGIAPASWEICRVGSMFELRREHVLPSDGADLAYIGLEHIDSGTPRLARYGDPNSVRSSKHRFYPGDILYGKLRPYLDKAVFADIHGICSTDILVLKPTDFIDGPFASFLVHDSRFLQHAIATTSGVNHPRTSWKSLSKLEIPLPPLHEQRAIARVLRTVQETKEKTEAVIAAAKELKKSLMKHLFTYGPVPVDQADQVKLKETEIGPVPEDWEVVEFGKLIKTGPQNGLYKPQSFYGSGVPIVRINDFPNEGGVVTSTTLRVRLDIDETEKYGLKPNDILVNRVNSLSHLGKTAFVPHLSEPFVFESNMMRLQVQNRRVFPMFAFRFLCSNRGRWQLQGRAKRAVAQSSINQGDLRSVIFPLPSLAHQEMSNFMLQVVEAKTAVEIDKLTALNQLFKTLLHDLMTAKIRVHDLAEAAP